MKVSNLAQSVPFKTNQTKPTKKQTDKLHQNRRKKHQSEHVLLYIAFFFLIVSDYIM